MDIFLCDLVSSPWIEKLVKNWSVFMKTEETSLDRFHRFLVNWPMNLNFFKKLKIFEIKNYKKTRADFKIFGQSRI
jgi:outer membrane protease